MTNSNDQPNFIIIGEAAPETKEAVQAILKEAVNGTVNVPIKSYMNPPEVEVTPDVVKTCRPAVTLEGHGIYMVDGTVLHKDPVVENQFFANANEVINAAREIDMTNVSPDIHDLNEGSIAMAKEDKILVIGGAYEATVRNILSVFRDNLAYAHMKAFNEELMVGNYFFVPEIDMHGYLDMFFNMSLQDQIESVRNGSFCNCMIECTNRCGVLEYNRAKAMVLTAASKLRSDNDVILNELNYMDSEFARAMANITFELSILLENVSKAVEMAALEQLG